LLTFKDDQLIARLGTEFIPVTANTQELQWRRSPAQKFYLSLVKNTDSETLRKQWASSSDPQGMYILGPDGTPYGFTNDHEPKDIQRFINAGLKGYQKHPPKQVEIKEADILAPWTVVPPAGSAVVRVFARIRPLPEKVRGLNRSIGRDFLWIYPEELESLKTQAELPSSLVGRIVRFHLVDSVRGTPTLWSKNEVQAVRSEAHLLKQEGNVRSMAFSIDFTMVGRRQSALGDRERVQQGYAGRLDGELDLDVKTGQLLRFRAFAAGKAWGEGTYTPNPPPGKFRLLVSMVEAQEQDRIASTVPPEGVATQRNDTNYRLGELLPVKVAPAAK
jgi:hypothetical protein